MMTMIHSESNTRDTSVISVRKAGIGDVLVLNYAFLCSKTKVNTCPVRSVTVNIKDIGLACCV